MLTGHVLSAHNFISHVVAFRAPRGRGEETGWNPVQLPLLCLQEPAVEAGSSHSGPPGEGMTAGAGA